MAKNIKLLTVTPVYKIQLNEFELKSVRQLLKLTPNLKHVLVAPKCLNTAYYEKEFNNAFDIQRFDDAFFKSPQTYNRLLRSLCFFSRFQGYSHLVMYHTDAWLFDNKLLDWAAKGYDYVGAPIYVYNGTQSGGEFICTGQGGFSMHNIHSAIKVLNSSKLVYPIHELNNWYKKYNWKGKLKYISYYLTSYFGRNRSSLSGNNAVKINEDIWWGKYVAAAFDWYSVPDENEAAKFSMEFNCSKLLANNNNQLPVGTHQWFNPPFKEFWHKYIT